ncbi:hypothetical protein BN7_6236 [Wickerhamomyces ciferrii]|uniref:Uncharacterized protein n=1 Tax=Wickerhamomyces ciferrii (strain ATCC 14091 / BCRC 22168 / CBS 111 / JCM 3599 / NBRC 0793 / NRRL Y-1031 F-60-10) TaxID=1206466 RepID=K0KTY2_WICCF|nr:uncharacterized protein BN7_6236 [Wickerhamomyces ciferrii]CCH46641.1 hypothetical protein BN7_6236 [Wickerhamomyces ciferrii]
MSQEPTTKKQKTKPSSENDQQPSALTIKKANEVFEFMRSKRLSIADFVSAIPYVSGNGRRQEVITQELFANEAVLEDLLLKKNYDVDLKPLTNVIGKKLLQELKNLQQNSSIFGKYKTCQSKTKDDLISSSSTLLDLNFNSIEGIDKEAPILTDLFKQLLSNSLENNTPSTNISNDNDDNNSNVEKTSLHNRLILILSVLCYSRNKKKSTNLPILFGLYLNSLGLTTKRGLQIFNKFGITVNQKTINDVLNDLSRLTEHEERNIQVQQQQQQQQPENNNNDNIYHQLQRKQDNLHISAREESRNKENSDALVLPFTQNIISSTNESYKTTSENTSALKISDHVKFNQFFDQYTQNT